MRYVLITPPAPVIDVEAAKLHLRVDHSDEDDLITALVAAATAHLDGRAGILGRAIGSQTWRLDVGAPCGSRVKIDMVDVSSVTAVKYISAGNEQTWAGSEWRLGSDGLKFFVEPKTGYSWPSTDDQEDALRVTFVAGMPANYPGIAACKAAILLLVGDLYENRETAVVGANSAPIAMTPTVDRLINPYRVRSL